jgi:translation initiation factor IF-2
LRVHELAKKYDKSNKEFLEMIKSWGVDAKSHLSGLTEDQIKVIEDKMETSEVESNTSKKQGDKKINNKKKKKKDKGNNKKFAKASKNKNLIQDKEESKGIEINESGEKVIKLRGEVSLKEFSEMLNINAAEIVKKLFLKGQMLTINSPISLELAEELAMEYDVLVEQEEEEEISFGEAFNLELVDKEEELQDRPPIITIMGHVDHGKTSLLDTIRKANVADGEAGGITQKIGAYQIIKEGKKITFIDTPGHEAFTEMRARGAGVTDIAILIVAADDGVKPQTVEAISHAKEAGVPIIVAVNKIDKPGADPMRVKTELMEYGLIAPEWGGDIDFVEISAKFNKNIDELLETILLTSELLELKANPNKRAKGVVLESRLDPKLGPVADVLIQEGELKVGEIFVAGESYGKVRALVNDKGTRVDKVGMATPVEILGFNTVPSAGDVLYGIMNEKQAKTIVEQVEKERKLREQNRKKHISLEAISQQLDAERIKELKLIIRADSRGSVEALKESLQKLNTDEVAVNVIQAAAGAISEGDVKLAEASDAIIIGFHVRPTTKAMKAADEAGVEIRTRNVIYHITEEIEQALTGMLDPEYKERYLGRIEIKKVFKISKLGNIAGCIVVDGKVNRESNIRMLRNGVVVYDGKLASLKRFQNDATEVVAGQECGLGIENFNDIKEGDIVEAYVMDEIKRTLR